MCCKAFATVGAERESCSAVAGMVTIGPPLQVLMNAQNRCSGAAQLLDLPAVFFDDREYLPSMYRLPAGRFL